MIITLILSMMQVAVTTLGARAVGRHLLKKVREFPHPALQVAAETGLGLALVSYVLFVLAIVGAANRISLAVLMAALALSAGIDCRYGFRTLARAYSATRWSLPLVGVGAVFVVVFASLAVLPPTAIDELIYHLEVPRQILQVGGDGLSFRTTSMPISLNSGKCSFFLDWDSAVKSRQSFFMACSGSFWEWQSLGLRGRD